MEEQKLFNTVNAAGISGVVTGIVVLVSGIACVTGGIMTLIFGSRLLRNRRNITF